MNHAPIIKALKTIEERHQYYINVDAFYHGDIEQLRIDEALEQTKTKILKEPEQTTEPEELKELTLEEEYEKITTYEENNGGFYTKEIYSFEEFKEDKIKEKHEAEQKKLIENKKKESEELEALESTEFETEESNESNDSEEDISEYNFHADKEPPAPEPTIEYIDGTNGEPDPFGLDNEDEDDPTVEKSLNKLDAISKQSYTEPKEEARVTVSDNPEQIKSSKKFNFTCAKSTAEKIAISNHFAEIPIVRNDLLFNPAITTCYTNSSGGLSKNRKLKEIETKIYNELVKNAKRKTKVKEKKELISNIIGNLILLSRYKNYNLYIDMKPEYLCKSVEKKLGIPISNDSRYIKNRPISKIRIKIINLMEKMKLIEKITGHISLKTQTGNKTQIKAIGNLKILIDEIQEKRINTVISEKKDELIKLGYKYSFNEKNLFILIDYKNSVFTNKKRELLERVNAMNEKSILTLDGSEILITPESQFYTNEFKSGGMYESYITKIIIEKGNQIFIDGEQTVKLNIQNSIINMFNHHNNIEIPEGDQYRLYAVDLERADINTDNLKQFHYNLIRYIVRTIIETKLKHEKDFKTRINELFEKVQDHGGKIYDGIEFISSNIIKKINNNDPLQCIELIINAVFQKHPHILKEKITHDFILFKMYNLMTDIRAKLVEMTDKNKIEMNYYSDDKKFSYKNNSYSHFCFYDSIICKRIHAKMVEQIMKSVCLAKYGFEPRINMNEGKYNYQYAKNQENHYWKIKRPTAPKEQKRIEKKMDEFKKLTYSCAAVIALSVRFFDGFKDSEQIAHKELVKTIMLETGYKDSKSRRIIKKYLDSDFIIACGPQRSRYYTLSESALIEGAKLAAEADYY